MTAPGQPSEQARESFAEEDKRWSRRDQVRDWWWLALMLFGYAAFYLLIFATEPGLR